MPVIVPAYAAILALIFVGLSFRVANARRTLRIPLGHGGNPTLERRIRVQGNFAEYVPLAIILLSFVELQHWPGWLVHFMCAILLAARLVHAYGVAQVDEDIRWRASAVVTTFTIIAISSILLLTDGVIRGTAG